MDLYIRLEKYEKIFLTLLAMRFKGWRDGLHI